MRLFASTDDTATAKRATKEQREKLGVDGKGKASKAPAQEPTNALQKVDVRAHSLLYQSFIGTLYVHFLITTYTLCFRFS